jgi:hypothetical protein
MRFAAVAAGFACACLLASATSAHAPATAIGRAVIALREVPVSYHPDSELSDLEADGLLRVVGAGDRVRVALLPSAALTEISGGPEAVAEEIAAEADVDGTVVALVGRRLAAASDRVDQDRLRALARRSEAAYPRGPLAARVADLATRVTAEPTDDGRPWGAIAAIVSALLLAGVVVLAMTARRAAKPTARMRDETSAS